jgi:hypothetical protein
VTRKLNALIMLFLLFVGLPFGWLMLDGSTRSQSDKPVTIAQLRQLADSIPGPRPVQVRYETIGMRRIVGDLLAAGSGLRPVPLAIRAYQLVLPQGRVITIDRGMSRKVAERHRIRDFDPVAQALVDRSGAVSALHLLLSPDVQHSGREIPSVAARNGATGTSETPFAVAPGVVVIPTDAVLPGERMIYVRLANGGELLFAGDVAPAHVSWEELRPPARLVTMVFVDDDREEIVAWLRTIRRWKAGAPQLQIIPGHDSRVPLTLTHGFLAAPDKSRSDNDMPLASGPAIR